MRCILIFLLFITGCTSQSEQFSYFKGSCDAEPSFQKINLLFADVFEYARTSPCRVQSPNLLNSDIYWVECGSDASAIAASFEKACDDGKFTIEPINEQQFLDADIVQYLD